MTEQTHNPLDQKIAEYSQIEAQIAVLTEKKEELRKEIFGYMEDNGLTEGYKNEQATVSYVQRKAIKIKDEAILLKDLVKQNIVRYFSVIPKHLELTKEFEKDVKDGKFKHELIDVEVSPNVQVRMNRG